MLLTNMDCVPQGLLPYPPLLHKTAFI